jgi:Ca2+-binding EF-hand superfamily protein
MAQTMVAREESPPATLAAKMPQYPLHHKDLGDSGDPASPHIRFMLALPEKPLLIEAAIFIDGQPFRQAREKRVQEIMRYIDDPVAFNTHAARIAAEAEATPAVNDAPGILDPVLNVVNGDAPAEEPTPPVVPKYAAPATIYERIDRYIKSTGTPPSVDEVRWLLTNWVDGPLLLFLNDNFQRFRANQQPVFKVLDRDRDGLVSADELTRAVAAFLECDLNRDDIVDATELAQAAKDVRDQPTKSTGKLIYRLPDDASATAFLRRLAALYAAPDEKSSALPQYDPNRDGVLSPEELRRLHERPADIRLTIEFTIGQPGSSRLTIDGFSDEFSGLKDSVKKNSSSMTLSFSTFNLEFLAAQGANSDQISIGAVNDGYAMLQEIDPNGDGRFPIRELRQLNERLRAFDRNFDGQISPDETHPVFRVCIGLGPTAHQPLALLREINSQSTNPPSPGPDWFTEMDKNKDFDLTRKEFPGTDEQFNELDSDGDGLISSVEANE